MRALTHRAVRAPLLPLPLVAPFALAAIVAIAGCKVGPNPKPLVLSDAEPALPTPADFTPPELTDTERAGDATALSATAADETPDAAAALDRWWTRFNDPKLDALVAQAEAANASIAQALSNHFTRYSSRARRLAKKPLTRASGSSSQPRLEPFA